MDLPDGGIEDTVAVNAPSSLRSIPNRRWIKFVVIGGVAVLILGGLSYWQWTKDKTIATTQVHVVRSKANKTTQSQQYMQDANTALENNEVSTALNYAIKADNDANSPGTSSFVAAIYQQEGNNAEAVKYYEKAASEAPVSSKSRDSSKQFYIHAAQAAQEAEQ